MRFVEAIDHSSHSEAPGDNAAASAFLFAIVGGLLVALAVPTIPVVAAGAIVGGFVGLIIAYH